LEHRAGAGDGPYGSGDTAGLGDAPPWDPLTATAVGLAIDAATAQAVTALREAGVRSILLKGPSFDAWLYDPDEARPYVDIDLLVASAALGPAACVLERLGYQQRSEREPAGIIEHATVWVRASDHMYLDLHHTLGGASPSEVDPWGVLAVETESMNVAGTEVEILSEPGRALHVALHAASSGATAEKPMFDLSRALERVPLETWKAAASLAQRLEAEAAFATGLRTQPAGARLCDQMGLPSERSVEALMLADSAPYASWTVYRLAKTPGIAAKLRIVAPRLLPEPEFMRVWYPVARRGAAGLAVAYVRRFGWLLRASGPAFTAWWRASREARRGN
jgi:Uncharacterised nucleotidyltransferase